jgi:hypothetical protein
MGIGGQRNERDLISKTAKKRNERRGIGATRGTTLPVGETEMTRNVQYWQDGYQAGYKAASSAQQPTLNTPK